MHLNRALVSSLLFVSAVLATDFRRGSIAGVMKKRARATKSVITSARGTFTLPELQGTIGSGLMVEVGLDVSDDCPGGSLKAGIQVELRADALYATGWAQFAPHTPEWHQPNPEPIVVSIGDRIRVNVEYDRSSTGRKGQFFMENLNTGTTWVGVPTEFDSEQPPCGDNAYWAVRLVPDGALTPIPAFDTVVFTDLEYTLAGQIHIPFKRFHFEILEIFQGENNQMTFVKVEDGLSSEQKSAKVIVFGPRG